MNLKGIREQIVYAYMRVSQSDLNLENQRPIIQGRIDKEGFNPANVVWLTEEESTSKERKIKQGAIQDAREGKVDVLIFARLDRWGRSMVELVSDIEELIALNVRVIIPGNGFDLSNQEGGFNSSNRLILQIFAAFAEFEKSIMRERTKDGIKRARAWGLIPGRHPVGCGCGFKSEDGKIKHNGPVKPIRDEKNKVIGWKKPDAKKSEESTQKMQPEQPKSPEPQQQPQQQESAQEQAKPQPESQMAQEPVQQP